MDGEWEAVPLASLLQSDRRISYGIVQPGAHDAHGVPIVRVGDVRDGRIATHDPLRVSQVIETQYKRTRLRGGELLLTLVGTVGETAIAPPTIVGWNLARAIALIPVREEIGAYWIRAALQQPAVRELILARLNTTVQATLNLADVAQLPIVLPPERDRTAIVDLLRALDDKIELNRRMAETLEAMARALFKSWFVDFDPVHAKAEGRPTGLPDELAALFPDGFGQDGLPEGWRSSAGAIGGLVRSMVHPAEVEPTTPYIGLEHLERRKLLIERWGSAQDVDSAKAAFRVGDLLFGKLRPYFHKVAVAPSEGICSSDIFVFRPRAGLPRSFLYMSFSQAGFIESASNASSGTRMPRADWSYMRQLPAILPPSELLAAFDRIVSPQIDAMLARAIQSRTLAALRDTLLPKLISGELRIAKAEREVAAA